MKKHILLIGFAFISIIITGQVNYSTDLDVLNADPGEGQWDGTGFSGTSTNACSGYSMKDNSWGTSSSQVVEMSNSTSLGTAAGGLVTVSYDYKMLEYNSSTAAATSDFKEIKVYSGTSNSGPWTLEYTLSSHTSSTSCVTKTFTYTPSVGAVYLQFTFEHSNVSSPDVDIFFDNISVIEAVGPNCSDGIQNGDETGVDCGGSCTACGQGACSVGYTELINEDFESGIPGQDASANVSCTGTDIWQIASAYSAFSGDYAAIDYGGVSCNQDASLIVGNFTGYANVDISYDHYYNYDSGDFGEVFLYNETDAVNEPLCNPCFTYNSDEGSSTTASSVSTTITGLDPTKDYSLRFRYVANYNWGWYIDNVMICGENASASGGGVPGCDSYNGSFAVSVAGYNTGASYTQCYALVNETTDEILEINNSGSFTGLSVGSYEIYAVNYEGSAPAQLAVGNTWTLLEAYEAGATGCIDLSTRYLDKVLTVCDTEEICEPDDIVVSTVNHTTDAGYSQVFVLVNSTGSIIASNSTGTFTISDYGLEGVYDVYACNSDEAAVLSEISDLGAWQDIPDMLAAGNCVDILGPRVIEVIDADDADCTGVLPVELSSFYGDCKDDQNRLNWVTFSEINNEGFYVEKSVDGKDFESVAFIQGFGNSSQSHNYEWIDKNTEYQAQYRLKQIDFDNYVAYSKAINVSCDARVNNDFLIINPNDVRIQLISPLFQDAQLNIYNTSGQLIYSTSLEKGSIEHAIPSYVKFNKEIYFFRINNQSLNLSKKYIHIQK